MRIQFRYLLAALLILNSYVSAEEIAPLAGQAVPVAEKAAPPAVPVAPPAEPVAPPTVPAAPPAVPAVSPAVPVAPPAEPVVSPTVPVAPPSVPAVSPAVPAAPPAVPAAPPAVPAAPPAVPVVPPAEPVAPPAVPVVSPAEPVAPPAVPVAPPAEKVNPFANQVGKWSFSMNDPGPDLKKLSSANRDKIRKGLQEITRLVTSTLAMTPPKGYEARFWGSISGKDQLDICTSKSCPPSRPNASLAMMIGRYEEKNGKKRAAFNSPAIMDISVNNLGHVFAHLHFIYKDKDGFLMPEPQRDGERLGMPAYLNNGHVIAVLTRNSNPLWLPVSRERYLQAATEAIRKDLGLPPVPEKAGKQGKQPAEEKTQSGKPILVDEGKTWIDPAKEMVIVEKTESLTDEIKDTAEVLQERMQQLQVELDALTPEQRTMQARVEIKKSEYGIEVTLLPPDSSGGVAVVTPNFGFFNQKLAPEVVQLAVVQWKFDGKPVFDPEDSGITENLNNRILLDIYKSMNWQKLLGKAGK